MPKPP